MFGNQHTCVASLHHVHVAGVGGWFYNLHNVTRITFTRRYTGAYINGAFHSTNVDFVFRGLVVVAENQERNHTRHFSVTELF